MRSQSSLRRRRRRPGRRGPRPELVEELERVAQPERDALQHRPPERAAVVTEREADECAAGVRIGMRASARPRDTARRGTFTAGCPLLSLAVELARAR